MAVVAERVDRHLVRGDDQRAIPRLSDLEGNPALQPLEPVRRDVVETREFDGGHEHGLGFSDADGNLDLVLRVVELNVETGHPCVGVPTIGIKGFNPLQVGIEAAPVEVVLAPPQQA
jgi:hypothetical protein